MPFLLCYCYYNLLYICYYLLILHLYSKFVLNVFVFVCWDLNIVPLWDFEPNFWMAQKTVWDWDLYLFLVISMRIFVVNPYPEVD